VTLGIALAFRPPSLRPTPSKVPTIQELHVRQYRGDIAQPLGDIGMTTQVVRANDTVRFSAKLTAPAYCYLIAFNPDGTEQLCIPEDPDLPTVNYPEHVQLSKAMATAPGRSIELLYPRSEFFEPGVVGLQVFVLIASQDPLPPYAQWRSQIGAVPWKPVSYNEPWRWHYDGHQFIRLPSERGSRVERGAPKQFKDLCRFFQSRPSSVALQALAFPIGEE
jgi:hypothetical protein